MKFLIAVFLLVFFIGCKEIKLKKNSNDQSSSNNSETSLSLITKVITTPLSHGDQNYVTGVTKLSNGDIFLSSIAGDSSGGWEWSAMFKSTDDGATFNRKEWYIPYQNGETHYLATTSYISDVYVCGYQWDNDNYTGLDWIVRKSTDGGDTWITVDRYFFNPADKICRDITVDQSNGNIYAIGEDNTLDDGAAGTTKGIVIRQSTDGGATWNTIHEYAVPGTGSTGFNIKVLPSGDLIIAGYDAATSTRRIFKGNFSVGVWTFTDLGIDLGAGTGYTGYQISGKLLVIDSNTFYYSGYITDRWQIVKTIDGGTSWTTVYSGATNQYKGHGLIVDSGGALYGIGTIFTGGISDVIVIKSTDSGSTWSETVSLFSGGNVDGLHLIFADNGDLNGYVSEQRGSVQLKSTDAGVTWAEAGHIHLMERYYNEVSDFKVAANGDYFAVGYVAAVDDTHKDAWYVGRSSDSGETWENVDLFSNISATISGYFSSHIQEASNGDLFVLGEQFNTGVLPTESIIRKSLDGGDTWYEVDRFVPPENIFFNPNKGIAVDNLGNLFHCVDYIVTAEKQQKNELI